MHKANVAVSDHRFNNKLLRIRHDYHKPLGRSDDTKHRMYQYLLNRPGNWGT